jgi:hypothetical protein
MPSPALNSATFTSLANGYSASDWSTFASDLNSNWLSAWQSRFNLTTRWETALGALSSADKSQVISACSQASSLLSAGKPLAVCGNFLDASPNGSNVSNINSPTTVGYLYANIPGTGITVVAGAIVFCLIYMNER